MLRAKILFALAIVLSIGLAAQPALAQRHGGAGGASHFNAPRAAQRGQNARGARTNRYQAAHPSAQGAAHPPNAFHPPANQNGQRAQENGATGSQQTGQPPYGNNFRAPGSTGEPRQNARQNDRATANLPPAWGQRLRNMSPQQQDRFLQNNERFKSLPPDQQRQVRQNLQKWNNLSPAERDRVQHSYQTWQHMSPEQRQYVQRTLLPKWQQMSPDRKQAVTDRLHTLQGMSPADRQAALNDPNFMQGLNPDEQSVLRGLDSVRNPSNP
ncbi:MAG: DUF3106 domain-containing protein [Candidatus Acidiferrales bacterium]